MDSWASVYVFLYFLYWPSVHSAHEFSLGLKDILYVKCLLSSSLA